MGSGKRSIIVAYYYYYVLNPVVVMKWAVFTRSSFGLGEISISKVHISAFKPAGFPYFQMGYRTPSREWDTK
jgi:hypothetical protein